MFAKYWPVHNPFSSDPQYHIVRTYDEKWCVDGEGVAVTGNTVVDDKSDAEYLRDLLEVAYRRGRRDGEEAKARHFRNVLGL